MTTNMEELERKMEIKIEGMKTMMQDWFSGVDQKLASIEQLLKKIVDTQNQVGNSLERRNLNGTEKNIGEGGIELSKNRDKGKTVAIRGGDYGPSHESGPEKSWKAKISRDDDNRETDGHILGPRGQSHLVDQGLPWEAGSPLGWVGLYTHHYGKDDPQGADFGWKKDCCGPSWLGQSDSSFMQKDRLPFGWPKTERGSRLEGFGKQVVETDESGWDGKKYENDAEKGWSSLGQKAVKPGQDEIFKDSLKSNSSGKVADKTDPDGEEEEQMRSWASCGNTNDVKTDASLQDSLKPDQWAKNDSGYRFKAMQNEINDELGSLVANEWLNEKGHEENQKSISWGWREEGLGSKRKHPDSPVEDPNNGPISSELFTATRQRLNVFTRDEQEILSEIEPILQSINRIMYQDGYNDGDPLSADDETYILDNVFNHHPDKARKLGTGLDYIMVNKYMNFQGSRCFYIVSTDGRKEDFSYHKCLKNFVRERHPDKADKFIPKYFKNSEPRHPRNRDRGSGPVKVRTPPWSTRDREMMVAAYEARTRSPTLQMRAGHRSTFGTKQKRACG